MKAHGRCDPYPGAGSVQSVQPERYPFNCAIDQKRRISTRAIDFEPQLWKTYGIDGLEPVSANNFGPREIHDINNYWDSPREVKFSIRVKW